MRLSIANFLFFNRNPRLLGQLIKVKKRKGNYFKNIREKKKKKRHVSKLVAESMSNLDGRRSESNEPREEALV